VTGLLDYVRSQPRASCWLIALGGEMFSPTYRRRRFLTGAMMFLALIWSSYCKTLW